MGVGLTDDRFEGGGRRPLKVAYRGRPDRHRKQVAHQPGGPALANPVRPAEQGARRLDPWAVPAAGLRRQGQAGDPPTIRARQPVPPVLGHDRADGRQFDDLVAERLGVVTGEGVRAPVTRAGA